MYILNLYAFNLKNILSRHMQYRFDFLFGLIVSILISVVQPLIQLVFYSGVNGYEGWSFKQILIFQGTLMIWIGLKDTLFGRIRDDVQTMVRDGSFDRMLNKPYSPLVLIFCGGFNFLGLGSLICGTGFLAYSIRMNGIGFGIPELLLCTVFMASGLILYIAVLITYCSILIHLVSMNRLAEVIDKFLRFSEYPLNIYPASAQWVLTFILPLALWIYLPSQAILHRLDKTSVLSIFVSFILLFLSIQFFKISLSRYKSAGG
ncbi:MAG TPA: ABC-2 family transporter protein [Clostridia bacterium]